MTTSIMQLTNQVKMQFLYSLKSRWKVPSTTAVLLTLTPSIEAKEPIHRTGC